ncbi:hypothetical protein AZH11_04210 [Pseudomonas simiae]|nr:hypothetical protein AZH11_04210 [Pseudomonas simiae]
MLTSKIKTTLIERTIRQYHHCLEIIKCAVTKRSHCEAKVEAGSATLIASGWIVSIPCNKYGSYQSRLAESVVFIGLPVFHIHGKNVDAGPFHSEHDAIKAQELLLKAYKVSSVVEYRDFL